MPSHRPTTHYNHRLLLSLLPSTHAATPTTDTATLSAPHPQLHKLSIPLLRPVPSHTLPSNCNRLRLLLHSALRCSRSTCCRCPQSRLSPPPPHTSSLQPPADCCCLTAPSRKSQQDKKGNMDDGPTETHHKWPHDTLRIGVHRQRRKALGRPVDRAGQAGVWALGLKGGAVCAWRSTVAMPPSTLPIQAMPLLYAAPPPPFHPIHRH